jgi:hypothetical protein
MTTLRKRILGVLAGLVLLSGAVWGVRGWQNQYHRSLAARTVTTQSSQAGPADAPIVIGPILR